MLGTLREVHQQQLKLQTHLLMRTFLSTVTLHASGSSLISRSGSPWNWMRDMTGKTTDWQINEEHYDYQGIQLNQSQQQWSNGSTCVCSLCNEHKVMRNLMKAIVILVIINYAHLIVHFWKERKKSRKLLNPQWWISIMLSFPIHPN